MKRPLRSLLFQFTSTTLLFCAVAAGTRGESASTTNWPQFRGPQACGVAQGCTTPTTWDLKSGANIRWRTPIPGLGHSSPIIWGDRLFVTTATQKDPAPLKVGLYGDIASVQQNDPQEWRLLALDKAKGKILWNTLAIEAVPRVKRHPKSTHCRSTPATDGKHIIAIFGSEGLFCFDFDGKLLWKKDLGPMDSGYFAVPSAQWGFASSPVIYDDRVIVQCDVLTKPFIAAFTLKDGQEVWRTPRQDVPTWSTPTVSVTPERRQVLVNGWHQTGGYDLDTGRQLWRLDQGGDIPVPTPIVDSGLVYLTSAHGAARPIRAVRLDATGDVTPPRISATNSNIVWVQPRQGNYMQTPIIVGDALYACFDAGILSCFDARTGIIRYSERLGSGGQGFTASPVAADGKIYFTSETGNVYVIPATGSFSVLATNHMDETCMATPALSAGAVFYRTRENLIAIGRP